MGKRKLRLSTSLIVDFYKDWNRAKRYTIVEDGLPDDAVVIEEILHRDGSVDVVLESREWAGTMLDDPIYPKMKVISENPPGAWSKEDGKEEE